MTAPFKRNRHGIGWGGISRGCKVRVCVLRGEPSTRGWGGGCPPVGVVAKGVGLEKRGWAGGKGTSVHFCDLVCYSERRP